MKKFLIIFCMGLACVLYALYASFEYKSLKYDHLEGVGTIIDCGGGGKGSAGKISLYYTFELNGKLYKESNWTKEFSKNTILNNMIGKSFPIIYNTTWYGLNSVILITPKNFTYYNLEFPDSLNWVVKYINK